MGKRVLLVLAVAIVAMVIVPATASAGLVNEYGMEYAGQQVCVDCHAFFGGTTTNTIHSRFVKEGLVPEPPAGWTEFRAAGTPPVVAGTPPALFNGGGTYDVDQTWLTFGDFAGGDATEYAFWRGSTDPNVLPWNLVEGLVAEPAPDTPLPIDEGEYIVGLEDPERGLYDVQYGCQRCHQLGSTVRAPGTEVVPNPDAVDVPASATTARQWARDDTTSVADFMDDPAVSYPGMSIQCENCHGTGVAATPVEGAHTNSGVKVSTTLEVLGQAQVCGQCHGSYTTVAGTLGIYGFTTNQPMRNFVDVNGTPSGSYSYTKIPTEAEFLAEPTKYFMFPNGSNAKGNHFYYNEWSATAHSFRPAIANDSPDASAFQQLGTAQYTQVLPAALRFSLGCYKCHTGEGYLKSKGAKIAAKFTPAPDNVGFMGQECVTCHNGHPSRLPGERDVLRTPDKAGARSATGLAVDNQSICEDCHNWQMEIMGTAPSYAPMEDITGHLVSHPQRETRHNRSVMVDVDMSTAEQFMPGAKCEDCHMPKTNRGANRFGHGMKPMLPTKAEEWMTAAGPSYLGEDSCSKCHGGETREELQANIEMWQEDTQARADEALAAILAVTDDLTPPAEFSMTNSSAPGYILIGRATWNFKSWEADASNGVHNPEYIQAGLEEAEMMANSVGGKFKSLFWSKSVVPGGTGFVTGKVVDGNDTGTAGAAGAPLVLYKNGVATDMETTADAQGNFAFMITPSGSAVYKVVWMRSGDARTHLSSSSMAVGVAKLASKTTLAASASSILVNKSVKLSGKVTPAATGQTVQIQYRRTTTSSWKAWGTPVALNATSNYAKIGPKLTSKGTWYFRTRYAGTSTVASSTSATVKVIVK